MRTNYDNFFITFLIIYIYIGHYVFYYLCTTRSQVNLPWFDNKILFNCIHLTPHFSQFFLPLPSFPTQPSDHYFVLFLPALLLLLYFPSHPLALFSLTDISTTCFSFSFFIPSFEPSLLTSFKTSLSLSCFTQRHKQIHKLVVRKTCLLDLHCSYRIKYLHQQYWTQLLIWFLTWK